MGKLRLLILLLLVIAIALFTRWLLSTVERPDKPRVTEPSKEPDYFLTQFTATVMGADGKPYYRLQGQRLEHFPATDAIKLTAPRLKYFKDPGLPWLVNSREGTVYENTRTVHLTGNVVVEREAPLPQQKLTLRTERLQVDTRAHTAETDAEVKITTQNSTIEATGMWVSLDEGRMHLLSNARGVYVP